MRFPRDFRGASRAWSQRAQPQGQSYQQKGSKVLKKVRVGYEPGEGIFCLEWGLVGSGRVSSSGSSSNSSKQQQELSAPKIF